MQVKNGKHGSLDRTYRDSLLFKWNSLWNVDIRAA